MMMILWIPFLILTPFAIVWLLHGEISPGHGAPTRVMYDPAHGPGRQEAMEIARLRLARGDITPDEFGVIRRAIG